MSVPRWFGAWVVVLALLLVACQPQETMTRLSGPTMGTTWNVTIAEPLSTARQTALRAGIVDELERINGLMSTWDAESELSRFNRAAVGQPFPLSPDTREVLRLADEVHRASGGAFDVTVGPLVNLWGFGPEMRPERAPGEAALAAAFQRVGQRHLRVRADGQAIRDVDLYVDLSAVAKGYAVDRIADLLYADGLTHFLVEVGGELRASGQRPGPAPWRIGIETPDVSGRSAHRIVRLSDIGVATSGDYRNYFESAGERFSHTLDPATGRPIHHRLASVTVLAPTAAQADAWATALMVLGPEDGLRVAREQNLAAFFIIRSDNGFAERQSPEFAQYLENRP